MKGFILIIGHALKLIKESVVDIIPELLLRQKTLLLFLASDEMARIDPIRTMKGLFILSQEAPDNWLPKKERYKFTPYLYGPFSQGIYNDLDALTFDGYVTKIIIPGQSWKYYSLSPEGLAISKSLAKEMNVDLVNYLREIRKFVSNHSFRQLLSAVYNKYPKFAVNSVFKG